MYVVLHEVAVIGKARIGRYEHRIDLERRPQGKVEYIRASLGQESDESRL